jgi:DMSO/TMAO reductase YedYZ molybdopterin-dependent catalytic subunit
MAGRRTNLALLCAITAAFLTGWLAFATGTGQGRWVVAAHGAAGLAIVLLTPWKSVIVRRGLTRRARGRSLSVTLSIAVVVAIVAGVGHATGVAAAAGPVTAMQVHVGAAVAAAALAVWHVRARPQRPRRSDVGRRSLLRVGLLAGAAVAAWAVVEGVGRAVGLPGARRRFTGSYERGSNDPARMPVTQWLDDRVPAAAATVGASAPAAAGWRLEVRAGGQARSWSYAELAAFDDRLRAILDCTGGWYAEQEWEGAWLDRLLPPEAVRAASRSPAGGSIEIVAHTGYRRRFPLADRGRLLLAVRVGGRPLRAGHGFPARVVAPGRRGFWWVKWVTTVEVSSAPWWRQPPFPLT